MAALAASVFVVCVTSAPLRTCPHHGTGPRGDVAPLQHLVTTATEDRTHARHDVHDEGAHPAPSTGEHTSHHDHTEPCTCLSHCEGGSAKPTAPPLAGLAQHDPPAPELAVRAPDVVLGRAPLPRLLPFPNPPPLPV